MVEYTQIGGAGGLGFDVLSAKPFGPKVPSTAPASSAYTQIGGAGGLGYGALQTLGHVAPTSTFTRTPQTNVPVAQYSHAPTSFQWGTAQSPGIPSTIIPTPNVSDYDKQMRWLAGQEDVLNQRLASKEIDQKTYDAQRAQLDEQRRSVVGVPGKYAQIQEVQKYRTLEKMGPLTPEQKTAQAIAEKNLAETSATDAFLAQSGSTQHMQAWLMSRFPQTALEKTSFRVQGEEGWTGLPEQYQATYGGSPYLDYESFAFQEKSMEDQIKEAGSRMAHLLKLTAEPSKEDRPSQQPTAAQAAAAEEAGMDIWEYMLESQKLDQAVRDAEAERQRLLMEGLPEAEPPVSQLMMDRIEPYMTSKNVAIVIGIIAVLLVISFVFGGSAPKPTRVS